MNEAKLEELKVRTNAPARALLIRMATNTLELVASEALNDLRGDCLTCVQC